MISKELLSEVLGKEVINFNNAGSTLLYNYYILEGMDNHKRPKGDKINLYELAHKCKEWANQHSYLLESDITGICKFNPDETCCYEEYFEAPTEPEAIFKACQWILDNKETK